MKRLLGMFALATAMCFPRNGAAQSPAEEDVTPDKPKQAQGPFRISGNVACTFGTQIAPLTSDVPFVPVMSQMPGFTISGKVDLSYQKDDSSPRFSLLAQSLTGSNLPELVGIQGNSNSFVLGNGKFSAENLPFFEEVSLSSITLQQVFENTGSARASLWNVEAYTRTQPLVLEDPTDPIDVELYLEGGVRFGTRANSLNPAYSLAAFGANFGPLSTGMGLFAPFYDDPQLYFRAGLDSEKTGTTLNLFVFKTASGDGRPENEQDPFLSRLEVRGKQRMGPHMSLSGVFTLAGGEILEGIGGLRLEQSQNHGFYAELQAGAIKPRNEKRRPFGRLAVGVTFN